jgi:hypothetical protein
MREFKPLRNFACISSMQSILQHCARWISYMIFISRKVFERISPMICTKQHHVCYISYVYVPIPPCVGAHFMRKILEKQLCFALFMHDMHTNFRCRVLSCMKCTMHTNFFVFGLRNALKSFFASNCVENFLV